MTGPAPSGERTVIDKAEVPVATEEEEKVTQDPGQGVWIQAQVYKYIKRGMCNSSNIEINVSILMLIMPELNLHYKFFNTINMYMYINCFVF